MRCKTCQTLPSLTDSLRSAFVSTPPVAFDSLSYDRSAKVHKLLKGQINPWQEEGWVLALSSQLHLISLSLLFRGSADLCLLHPRDVFRTLIQANASFFIFAHNHPSGRLIPSREDLRVTEKLKRAGVLMEIPLIDHVIVTSESFYSFADAGRLKTKASTRA